jgi:hypothetical protein
MTDGGEPDVAAEGCDTSDSIAKVSSRKLRITDKRRHIAIYSAGGCSTCLGVSGGRDSPATHRGEPAAWGIPD